MWTQGKTANPQLTDGLVEPRRLDQLQSVDLVPRVRRASARTALRWASSLDPLSPLWLRLRSALFFPNGSWGYASSPLPSALVGHAWRQASQGLGSIAPLLGSARRLALFSSWILLAPIFLVGFTLARAWMRLSRADPLQLRRTTLPTYWLSADTHERKLRFVSAMFAGERVNPAECQPRQYWGCYSRPCS